MPKKSYTSRSLIRAVFHKSLTGQLSNLGDAWDTMLNEIGKDTQGIASAGISGLKGPAVLSRLRDSLYIIYQKRLIVKRFSESFLKKFSSKNIYRLL